MTSSIFDFLEPFSIGPLGAMLHSSSPWTFSRRKNIQTIIGDIWNSPNEFPFLRSNIKCHPSGNLKIYLISKIQERSPTSAPNLIERKSMSLLVRAAHYIFMNEQWIITVRHWRLPSLRFNWKCTHNRQSMNISDYLPIGGNKIKWHFCLIFTPLRTS